MQPTLCRVCVCVCVREREREREREKERERERERGRVREIGKKDIKAGERENGDGDRVAAIDVGDE